MKANCKCHFCKEDEIRILNAKLTPGEQGLKPGYQVECVNCGARGPGGHVDTANAVCAWEGLDTYYGLLSKYGICLNYKPK
jgi:hypothetical protein